ncbi:Na+/H+ antiporter NhaC family protein [Caldisalinibacter kiritimatiensis]|uniref:Na+/H+ antiporter n=1 Tax=Caldisalinibacter kiritimatiensis TaxID=1304284 RepID=R1CGU4_9FIRM|nr:Na+/H+ antiporter NhaC family protein [Caldisalinibacter kiritimatiensis]EOD01505.1 Na+/H+ antiporter [Caldisalinibacter kiritimatiensis]
MLGSAADSWNAAILIFTLSIGGMVGVIGKMGGTKAIAEALAKKAKTARSAQIATWILGLCVFFDDYANTLIVGPTMRPLTDKLKVSREKLAYIVDSTAAPVVGMALVSTWIGYEIGLIKNAYESIGIDANIYGVFIKTIPYRFYSIFALILVLVLAISRKEFGPMYDAEKRARLTGKVLGEDAKPMASDEITKMELKEGTELRASNAIVPILTLIVVSFIGLWYNGYNAAIADGLNIKWYTWVGIRESFGYADASVVLIWGAVVASIVAITMAVSQKILSLGEAFDSWVEGAKSLLITCMILVLAWSLGSVTDGVGTADFLVGVVSESIPGGFLPILVFVISCLVAFSTGTSWGTMAIVIPLAVPLANSYVVAGAAEPSLIIATLSSVLTGSIFGDHCSPISDTTIMSSMASASDHIDHVKTQVPYALTGAVLAILGYIIVGLSGLGTIPALLISLVGGVILIIVIVQVLGKSVAEEDLLEAEKKTVE